ncbi:hypothetical protein ACG7TL_008022 [Trametes sanguinea]
MIPEPTSKQRFCKAYIWDSPALAAITGEALNRD